MDSKFLSPYWEVHSYTLKRCSRCDCIYPVPSSIPLAQSSPVASPLAQDSMHSWPKPGISQLCPCILSSCFCVVCTEFCGVNQVLMALRAHLLSDLSERVPTLALEQEAIFQSWPSFLHSTQHTRLASRFIFKLPSEHQTIQMTTLKCERNQGFHNAIRGKELYK